MVRVGSLGQFRVGSIGIIADTRISVVSLGRTLGSTGSFEFS